MTPRIADAAERDLVSFHSAPCCAITKAGKRCTGRWSTAVSCMFKHDATTGDAILGPKVVLCHRHRHWVYRGPQRDVRRLPVVHGWLGSANKFGYGTAVFDHPYDGMRPAGWWWERRKSVAFGEGYELAPSADVQPRTAP